jgi:hypothetical protein
MFIAVIACAILLLLSFSAMRWSAARARRRDLTMREHYDELASPVVRTGEVHDEVHYERQIIRGASGGNAHDRRRRRRQSS